MHQLYHVCTTLSELFILTIHGGTVQHNLGHRQLQFNTNSKMNNGILRNSTVSNR